MSNMPPFVTGKWNPVGISITKGWTQEKWRSILSSTGKNQIKGSGS
jgi:hypothetical protein